MPTKTVETYTNGVLSSTVTVNVPQAEVNEDALQAKARQALTVNATYLALTTPTGAETTAQVKALTRETSALIKLLLNDLADISGT